MSLVSDRLIVGRAVSDREIEYRWIERESRNLKFIPVTPQSAARQKFTCYVVQPETLAQFMEPSC